MKLTKNWLQDHLITNKTENQIVDKLNNIGLEVEKIEETKNELSDFIVAKIIKYLEKFRFKSPVCPSIGPRTATIKPEAAKVHPIASIIKIKPACMRFSAALSAIE